MINLAVFYHDLPLLIFTVLSQTAIGLILALSCYRYYMRKAGTPLTSVKEGVVITMAIAFGGAGLIASVFHVGHPLEVYRMIAHLGIAWLSNEVLFYGLFLFCLASALFFKKTFIIPASIFGILTIFSSSLTYAPPAFTALYNAVPFALFSFTTLILGCSLLSWFVKDTEQKTLWLFTLIVLCVGLVVYLILPCVWASGDTITMLTAKSWISSPLYWGGLVIGYLIPAILLFKTRKLLKVTFLLCLVGELALRAVFFYNTIHTATNIGNIY